MCALQRHSQASHTFSVAGQRLFERLQRHNDIGCGYLGSVCSVEEVCRLTDDITVGIEQFDSREGQPRIDAFKIDRGDDFRAGIEFLRRKSPLTRLMVCDMADS